MDAAMLVTILILVFTLLFLLALVAPKKLTTIGGGKPHRGKAFLFYFIPIIVLLFIMASINNKELELAETEPEKVNYLLQSDAGLKAWPDFTSKVVNIDRWDLSDNSLEEISEDIRALSTLRKLELTNNPISLVPSWMTELDGLEILDLRGTKIDSTSLEPIFALKEKGVKVRFTNTPLLPEKADESESEEAQQQAEDEHTESFWQFAERRLLYGSEDQRRFYKKGELYFEEGISIAQVDTLGAVFEQLGLFSEDKEVTAKLTHNGDRFEVKVVTIYDAEEDLKEEEIVSWEFITAMISAQAFEGEPIEVHLCDDRLNVIKEFMSK